VAELNEIPRKVWIWGGALAGARALGFCLIYANQSHDAQWQLSYFPLWVIDFPVSIFYFVIPVPIPAAEGIVGPIWWFFLPLIVWRLFLFRRKSNNRNGDQARRLG
jgi:hypothetical protein